MKHIIQQLKLAVQLRYQDSDSLSPMELIQAQKK